MQYTHTHQAMNRKNNIKQRKVKFYISTYYSAYFCNIFFSNHTHSRKRFLNIIFYVAKKKKMKNRYKSSPSYKIAENNVNHRLLIFWIFFLPFFSTFSFVLFSFSFCDVFLPVCWFFFICWWRDSTNKKNKITVRPDEVFTKCLGGILIVVFFFFVCIPVVLWLHIA